MFLADVIDFNLVQLLMVNSSNNIGALYIEDTVHDSQRLIRDLHCSNIQSSNAACLYMNTLNKVIIQNATFHNLSSPVIEI